jgi:hypothetical protein
LRCAWEPKNPNPRPPILNPESQSLAGAWEAFHAADNTPFYLSTVDGCISLEPPPLSPDVRGGLLCDEPGMGKTITVIALILKTLRADDEVVQNPSRAPFSPPKAASPAGMLIRTPDRSNSSSSLLRSSRRSSQRGLFEAASPASRLHSDATLIVCPSTMVEHWAYQARNSLLIHTPCKCPWNVRVWIHNRPTLCN